MRTGTLLLISALILTFSGLFYMRQPAQADCPDGAIGVDDTITCTGTDTNGSFTFSGNDSVTIEPGASVSDPVFDAINTGDGNDTVVNNGTVNSGSEGIDGGNGDDTLTNNGSITSTATGMQGNEGNNTLVNNGSITAGTAGMETLGNAGLASSLENNGTINCGGVGMFGDSSNDLLVNNGTITCAGDGMNSWTGNDVLVNNGTIVVATNDINSNGMETRSGSTQTAVLINNGSITSGGIGIYGDSSHDIVENYGTIVSNANTAINTLANNDEVYNAGTIIGGNGTAVDLGSGNDSFTTELGAYIFGTIDGSTGTDTLNFAYIYTFESEDFFVPAEYDAIVAQLTADLADCTGACAFTVTVNGVPFTYVYKNFEDVNLLSFLNFIKITFTPYDEMNCQNGVKCFALKDKGFRNGNVQIMAAEGSSAVGVATVNFRLLGAGGYSFTNADNGWTVEISFVGTEGTALTYLITLSRGDEVRHAMTRVHLHTSNNALTWQ